MEAFVSGTMLFRHEAVARRANRRDRRPPPPEGEVPARGGTVSRPCFVADARRLMMPAFGAYTGGLDVRDPAITRLFPRGGRVVPLGKERLFSFTLGTLRSG